MPLINGIVASVPLSSRGVDLSSSEHDIKPGFAKEMKNCFFRRGVQGRLGYAKHSTNEVATNKKIVGLHRFYYSTASRQLIAVAGTTSKYLNEGTGAWVDLKTGLTDGLETFINTWSAVEEVYLANGTDAPYSWDGSTASTLGAFPVTTKMMLPYRDRLLFIDTGNPSYIRWTTGSYDDSAITTTAQAIRMVEGGAINIIAPHTLADEQNGINAMVLVGTGGAVSLFSGTDLDPASSGFNVRLDAISSVVGITAPRSVVSTPIGTIFLGSDRQVYLLRHGSTRLDIIGKFIQSTTTDIEGIESIPTAQVSKVCAVYHDGFYKLAIPVTGNTTPTKQYWLDILNIFQDEDGRVGPWYGPMTGQPAVSMFVTQNGNGDDARLIAGNSASLGFVFEVDKAGTFSDDSSEIACRYQTHHQFFTESEGIDVDFNQYEIETKSITNSMILSLKDTDGGTGSTVSISAAQTGTLWGTALWNSFNWGSGTLPARQSGFFDVSVNGRQMSSVFEYVSSTDRFGLLKIRYEVSPREEVFAV